MRAPIASGCPGCRGVSRRCVIPLLDPGTILDRRGDGLGLGCARLRRSEGRRLDLRDVCLVAIDADQPDRADGDQGNEARQFYGVPTPGTSPDSAAAVSVGEWQ